MKTLSAILVAIFVLLSFTAFSQKGVIVEGIMMDAEEEYIMLAYSPRLRGNLNFDGVRSVGSPINAEGKFRLKSKKLVHAASYRLFFPKNWVPLQLFQGDSIYLEIYLANPEKTFARGKGAAKINILRLPQFQYGYFDLEVERNLQAYANYIDSIISYQVSLLDAIYSRQAESPLISEAPNRNFIQKIITHAQMSKEEYSFLLNQVEFRRYSLLSSFLRNKSAEAHLGNVPIDFNSSLFSHFNAKAYSALRNINDFMLHAHLISIIQIEYLKQKQSLENVAFTYGSWHKELRGDEYHKWCAEFLIQNFDRDLYNKYYAEDITGMMTWGLDYTQGLGFINLNEDNKYVRRIKGFGELLKNGLDNKEYDLNHEEKNLDAPKFEVLLKKYKQSSLMLVFWSAQAAGASIIDELPSLRAFEEDQKDKIDIAFICVDKQENKNLWAARIIDESWKANHYFMPIGTNKTTLDAFTDEDISSLCSGGASYSFIDKSGAIQREVGGPFYLKEKEIEELHKMQKKDKSGF